VQCNIGNSGCIGSLVNQLGRLFDDMRPVLFTIIPQADRETETANGKTSI